MGINFQERVMFYTDSDSWIHKWLTNRHILPPLQFEGFQSFFTKGIGTSYVSNLPKERRCKTRSRAQSNFGLCDWPCSAYYELKIHFPLWKIKLTAWTSSIGINLGLSLQPGDRIVPLPHMHICITVLGILQQSCFLVHGSAGCVTSEHIWTRHWCADLWSQLPAVCPGGCCDLRRTHSGQLLCDSPALLRASAFSSQRSWCDGPTLLLPKSSCLDGWWYRICQRWQVHVFCKPLWKSYKWALVIQNRRKRNLLVF